MATLAPPTCAHNDLPTSPTLLVFPQQEPELISHSFSCPDPSYLSPRSCLNPSLPIPPPAKLPPRLLPAKGAILPSFHSWGCQHPLPTGLPELEDDAGGHEDNDDGDGNCDIELRVHTCLGTGRKS